jgi:hypothetical protein
MTYIYYKSSTYTTEPKISEKQLNKPADKESWVDITRRETMEGAENAVDNSVEHFSKKIEYIKGPKVVKTFK